MPGHITVDVEQSVLTDSVISPSVLNSKASVDPNLIGGSNNEPRTKITLRDLKKIIERDDNFSEVTVEQIERVKLMHDKFMDGAVFNFNYNTLHSGFCDCRVGFSVQFDSYHHC